MNDSKQKRVSDFPPAHEKEVRAILRRLIAGRARLEPIENDAYGLFAGRGFKPILKTSPSLIALMRRHDLLVADGENFTISEAGEAWYRRLMAESEEFRQQHQRRMMGAHPEAGNAVVNIRENILLWLLRRKTPDGKTFINRMQYEAGMRFHEDFIRAHEAAGMVTDLSRPPRGKHESGPVERLDRTEAALAARQRFNSAIEILGQDLADIAVEVCCHMSGLEEAERNLGVPRSSAKVILRIALDHLARHYGLARFS